MKVNDFVIIMGARSLQTYTRFVFSRNSLKLDRKKLN